MALKKNDLITVNIEGMTAEGSGVARHEGMAVFVPNAAPNDRLSVRIIKLSKNYAVGKIHQVITPGDGRIKPDCPSYPKCGGCTFRHLDYVEECREEQEERESERRDAVFAAWIRSGSVNEGGKGAA